MKLPKERCGNCIHAQIGMSAIYHEITIICTNEKGMFGETVSPICNCREFSPSINAMFQ